VVGHPTDGIESAGIGTRIAALHIDTGPAAGTIAILHAFRAAIDVRITEIVLDAGAGADSIAHTTNGIGTTWRWVAWIRGWIWHHDCHGHENSKQAMRMHTEKCTNTIDLRLNNSNKDNNSKCIGT